jgi:hypothetical protein
MVVPPAKATDTPFFLPYSPMAQRDILLYEVKAMASSKPHIKVYGSPEVLAEIKEMAAKSGMSHSQFCRRIVTGKKIKQVSDTELMRSLSEINNNLARYGNLLKLWLTNDRKVSYFGASHISKVVQHTINTHEVVKETMSYISGKFE